MVANLKLLIFFAFILFVGYSIQQQTDSSICSLNVNSGYCNAEDVMNSSETENVTTALRLLQLRYAFRNSSNTCVPFLYTGCRGNANNFASFDECRNTCGGQPRGG